MTQVLMTLAEGQGLKSRSNLSIVSKKLNSLSFLGSYFTYRLHTWYQRTTYESAFNNSSANDINRRSRVKVNFSQKWVKRVKKIKQLAISWMLFHQQTSYLEPWYNTVRLIQ